MYKYTVSYKLYSFDVPSNEDRINWDIGQAPLTPYTKFNVKTSGETNQRQNRVSIPTSWQIQSSFLSNIPY